MPRRPDMPPLAAADLDPDPIEQFRTWFAEAESEAPLAEAVALATVDGEGLPDARMVLLKGFGPDGFRFFTNYGSAKALQLDAGGAAALIAYWRELDRQVRVRGTVERLGADDSDAYFATRPRDSQLGAWASPQSRPLESRAELDTRLAEATERYDGGAVPRPAHWGGYLLRPRSIEFWQGQVARLHDRFRYARDG
ncbi:MAG: pyridoxamine 5'-phosphate oxidase, partial [Solirubrobacterales bacterium]